MTLALTNASSKYGASMGRTNQHNPEAMCLPVTFELVRLAWVDGDYDSGGAYWGHETGEWIYRASCPEHEIELWIRATSDAQAQEQILADYPKATFTSLPPEDVPLSEDEKTYWFTTSSGRIELELTMGDAERVSHPGPCDADVAELRQIPRIARQLEAIKPDVLRAELRDYGFEPESLANHEDNLDRILWLAGCDIRNNNPEE